MRGRHNKDVIIFLICVSIPIAVILFFVIRNITIRDQKWDAILANEEHLAEALILALDDEDVGEWAMEKLNEIGVPLLVALEPVCDGEAVAAKAYDPSESGPHALVFLSDTVSYEWTYDFLKDFGPASLDTADVELVVFATQETEEAGTCQYETSNGSVTTRAKIRYKLYLDVYIAATGELLKSYSLLADKPKCPSSIPANDMGDIWGDPVSQDEVIEILEGYYN